LKATAEVEEVVMAELMAEPEEEDILGGGEDMAELEEAVVIMGLAVMAQLVDMAITHFIMENMMTITQVMIHI
jgi:hypothetical protein